MSLVLFFLYWFIFALDLLGEGAQVLTGCVAGGLFGENTNPVASLIIGVLATALFQSSSTTSSIVVSLVGAGSIPVEPGIYMIMGANIGTSVTNTIVAMGQMGNGDELECAFAGATVHDMFNFLSVLVLFPIEVITSMLAAMTSAMVKDWAPSGGSKSGGISTIIDPITNRIIIRNRSVIINVAEGGTCEAFYPTECNPSGTRTFQACNTDGRVGLIQCDRSTGKCPIFFTDGASERDDVSSGGIALLLGIIFLVICLLGLVMVLKRMLLGASTRIIKKATAINGYVSMLVGCGITMAVQSSTITTSVLTPLVGVGLVSLDDMFPLTLGANIGTTITGILAAVVSGTPTSMQVALAHFFFNIFGIIIWYPVPLMRRVPIAMAKALGRYTRWWRGFPLIYLGVAFFCLPLLLLGISNLFISDLAAFVALGVVVLIVFIVLLAKALWWWFKKDGEAKIEVCFRARQHAKDVHSRLVHEWDPLVNSVKALKEHVGLEEEQLTTKSPDVEKDDKDETEEQFVNVSMEAVSKKSAPMISVTSV